MRKSYVLVTVFCALVGLGIGTIALGNMAVKGDEPGMMVSPQMIVLDKVAEVTVHTNIPLAGVISSTVMLDGVLPVGSVWADDCGQLAARFAVADLGLAPGDATLTLTGTYVGDGTETFSASDDVRVK